MRWRRNRRCRTLDAILQGGRMNEQGRLQVAAVIGTSNRRLELYRRTYPLRTLGMGLAVLPALVLLGERQAGWIAWAFTLFCGFIWPHLAWLHARFRRDPHQAEHRSPMPKKYCAAHTTITKV